MTFEEVWRDVAGGTLVPKPRGQVLYDLALQGRGIPGAFAEVGVYKGGTALLLAKVLEGSGRRLVLFDTFSGLPRGIPGIDPRYLVGGELGDTSAALVRGLMGRHGYSPEIREGFFPKTATPEDRQDRYALVHVDVDIYRSALDCLEFFFPRLSPGGVMVFDDYGSPECAGVKRAIQEFGKAAVELSCGSAVVREG